MYLIIERNPDPRFGAITMVYNPLLDGPIEGYIQSRHFIVRDREGNEVKADVHSGSEEIHAFVNWHNEQYPDNYIPNSEIGRFNLWKQKLKAMAEIDFDVYVKEHGLEKAKADHPNLYEKKYKTWNEQQPDAMEYKPVSPDPELVAYLGTQLYENFKQIPGRGLCATTRMLYTWGLVIGLDAAGSLGRYCFETEEEAVAALNAWDGTGDPAGNWIKYKGIGGERSNPNKI